MSTPPTGLEQEDVKRQREELEALLASPLFARAPSLRNFLVYICEAYFEGRADSLKEYSIAVEALGRSANFDHTIDSIVRVEAHKLRKKLRRYYETEGADHEWLIEVPRGQYVPQFVRRRDQHPARPAPPDFADDRQTASRGEAAAASSATAEAPASVSGPHSFAWNTIALVCAAVVGVGLLAWRSPWTESAGTAATNPVAAATDVVYRISAGSPVAPYVDDLGRTWSGDQFFEGGRAVQKPEADIPGSLFSPDVYRSWREGSSFAYRLPLEPGVYELHLHFSELVFGPANPGTGMSSRIFHVSANGKRLLEEFDILAHAGLGNVAAIKVFNDLRPTEEGVLLIEFEAVSSVACVSGIEVFPGIPGQARPVRILAGDRKSPVIDESGQGWGPDRYFTESRSVPRMNPIRGAEKPNLFAAERFGNFRYFIPVADGRYTVNLHFAETWFGPENPGGGGAGSRIFDVYCNGKALLRGFDVFREAGGENRAIMRSFSGIEPNPQGIIELAFIPKRNYAFVNAIEVLPE